VPKSTHESGCIIAPKPVWGSQWVISPGWGQCNKLSRFWWGNRKSIWIV